MSPAVTVNIVLGWSTRRVTTEREREIGERERVETRRTDGLSYADIQADRWADNYGRTGKVIEGRQAGTKVGKRGKIDRQFCHYS